MRWLSLFHARRHRRQLALHIYCFFFISPGEIFDFELWDMVKSVSQQPPQPTRRRIIYDKIKFEMLIDAERAESSEKFPRCRSELPLYESACYLSEFAFLKGPPSI
jgi:hypothetical protein